jgi:hypothetical protein
MTNHVKITSDGLGCNTKIFVDDKELECVTSLTIECKAGGLMTATLVVIVDRLELDGQLRLNLLPHEKER